MRELHDVDAVPAVGPEVVTCRFCGRPAPLRLATRDWNRLLSQESFRYYRCTGCQLTFLSPVPADLARYYPADYYPMPASLADLAQAAEGERYKLTLVQRYRPGGRLLEIGPSAGAFAYLAKQAGYEVDTIEIDGTCCRFLRDVVGVRAVQSGEPAAAMVGLDPYDVIVLWHVIEHIPDPWETLSAAANCLRPGGVVVIGAPNPGAFQLRVFGPYWTHIDAPRHLQLLPIESVVRHAGMLGLQPRLRTMTNRGDLGWNAFGWERSVENVFKARSWEGPSRAIGRALSLLALPVDRAGKLGSTYTLVLGREAG